VDPAGAIQQYKLTATIERFKSFLMPWSKNEAAEKKKSGEGEKDEANEKHFKVTNITMISDTCPAAGTARKTKKSKSDSESGAPPSN